MAHLIEFEMADGGTVVVEADDEQLAGFQPAAASPGEVAAKATESFEAALDRLLPPIAAIGERMRSLSPEEVQVELGVKLTAEAGVIVAKAAAEANFIVRLRWTTGG